MIGSSTCCDLVCISGSDVILKLWHADVFERNRNWVGGYYENEKEIAGTSMHIFSCSFKYFKKTVSSVAQHKAAVVFYISLNPKTNYQIYLGSFFLSFTYKSPISSKDLLTQHLLWLKKQWKHIYKVQAKARISFGLKLNFSRRLKPHLRTEQMSFQKRLA